MRKRNYKILEELDVNGLSQKDLAKLTGEPASTISRIVNQVWVPDDLKKLKIAKALKKNVKDLFG